MNEQKCIQAKTDAMTRFAADDDHINCSQTVLAYSLQVMGHDPKLVTLANYFGGGIVGKGEACGAITGAAMALGVRDFSSGESGHEVVQETSEIMRQLQDAFVEQFGSPRCRDLTGFDLSTPEGFEEFMASDAKGRCPVFVQWMMDAVTPYICGEE